MQHAKYSPSSAHRWLQCPSSVEHTKPHDTNSAAQEGQLAHSQAETILRGGKCDDPLEYVQDYVDYVRAIPGDLRLIEGKFDYGFGFGTSDAMILDDETCHIIDLKYGKVHVDVVDNPQLKLYAAGVWLEYGFLGIDKFVLHIYQPRADNIATWEVSADEVRLFHMYAEHRSKASGYSPSTDACRYCHHMGKCKALSDHMIEQFDDFSHDKNIPWVIENATHIIGWVKEVKTSARERLQAGESVEGLKLVKGKNYRKWVHPDQAPQTMQPLSPAQAAKAGIEDMPEVVSVQGAPVVALESDKRPSIIEEMFDALPCNEGS